MCDELLGLLGASTFLIFERVCARYQILVVLDSHSKKKKNPGKKGSFFLHELLFVGAR
jgi:hypothetical protein